MDVTTTGRRAFRGALITPDQWIDDGVLVIDGPTISYVGDYRPDVVPDSAELVTLEPGDVLVPGLVDLHCHGGGGAEFGPDVDHVAQAMRHHWTSGTTSVVASLVSAPVETLLAGIDACAASVQRGDVLGVHVEGPFLSHARCGAQDPTALIAIDVAIADRIIQRQPGTVVSMTLAPELPGANALIRQLANEGVLPSLGHTDADAAQMRAALDQARGALGRPTTITHLFNAMPPMHHRSPGAATAALAAVARGDAVAELVADGVHLDPAMVTMMFDVSAPDGVILVSDSMAAAGLADGDYVLGRLSVRVAAGVARLVETGAIAGGTQALLQIVATVIAAGVDPVKAVRAASFSPARALGRHRDIGSLTAGCRADILLVSATWDLRQVWRAGQPIT